MFKALVSICLLLSMQVFACDNTQAVIMKKNLKMEISAIASNIANANTTRTLEGGPYKRQIIVCENSVCEVVSYAEEIIKYLPDHPDADEDGYVRFPNIDISKEMSDMLKAQRAYDDVIDCR